MGNIDTRVTKLWGQTAPQRSSLTQIANQIAQIRSWHNEEFRKNVRTRNSPLPALRLQAAEERAITSAVYRHGWTLGSLEAELTRRTTARWARKIIHGWF